MKIYTYAAVDPDAPAVAIARIWLGPKKSDWHPVIFTAENTGLAFAQAMTWWENESAKADKRRGPRKPKPQTQQPDAEVGDVI